MGQRVIELAGDAANGVRGHVGLIGRCADAGPPGVRRQVQEALQLRHDHNGIKGYTAVYLIKYVTEKVGKFDSKAFAQTLHGMTITPAKEPGILMEATWDKNGDIDRESFLGQVVDGKQKIVRDPAQAQQVGVGDPAGPAPTAPGKRTKAMASFIQLLVSGLATGAIYALVAVGFTLLWQTSQTINFAQGEFVMLPAFFVLAAMKLAGIPFWAAALVGIAVSVAVLGVLFKRIIVDPMLKHGVLPLVISTIALSLFLKESAKEFYSAQAQRFPSLVEARDLHVFGAVVSTQSLAVLAVALVTVVALHLLLHQTRLGRSMQATAQNPTVARILGIPVERMILYTFLINAVLVAIASHPHQPDLSRQVRQRRGAWGWRPSSRRSSAASTRCAAPFWAACCSACSTICRPPMSRRHTGAPFRCCC